MLTPNQQKSSKNQQKKEKKNLPVEVNEKSTINIPENPLQLGWPEISKPSFFFSWPPSQAQRILPLAPEKSPWSSLESSPSSTSQPKEIPPQETPLSLKKISLTAALRTTSLWKKPTTCRRRSPITETYLFCISSHRCRLLIAHQKALSDSMAAN